MGSDCFDDSGLRHANADAYPSCNADTYSYSFADLYSDRYGDDSTHCIPFALQPGEYTHTNAAGHPEPNVNSTEPNSDPDAAGSNSYGNS